ncbi:hypothetical protein BJ742DRAFT_677575 [Cladochytrium replicatum]|nr:hypothetical protein BJ742DRAFT_677575 [Cladochytrium replicatum]
MPQQRLQRGRMSTAKDVIPLSTSMYPHLQRDDRFKKLTDDDIAFFRNIFGEDAAGGVVVRDSPDDSDLLIYNMDWMKKYRGQSTVVLRPRTTNQVSEILAYCSKNSIAVVPQGGNTGLVGGSVPVFDEVVLNLGRMDSIRGFDEVSGIVVTDSGVVLEKLDGWLAERGFMCPLDLGAKGSCHIGGNVATNAGGLRLLRYGSLHGTVLGLEAVLPDGTILDNLSTLRKDNTGYDLKQLFIGSEGTIGVVTAVSILTPPRAKSTNVALLALPSFDAVQTLFRLAKQNLSEILSAFEFWDSAALKLARNTLHHVRFPDEISGDGNSQVPFWVLVETQGSEQSHDFEKLERFLDLVMSGSAESGPVVLDGLVAQDEAQATNFWALREGFPEACSKSGKVYKYDISMPVPVLYQMVEDVRNHLTSLNLYDPSATSYGPARVTSVAGYGHVGDGNLHLNIIATAYSPEILAGIEPYVYEWAQKYRGSVSAEHGLGLMKRDFVGYSKSPAMVQMMKRVKDLLDPKGIMNPYKYLP